MFRPHTAVVTRTLVCRGFSALVTRAVMIARRHDIGIHEKMQPEVQLSLLDPLIWPLVPVQFRARIALLWQLEARLTQLSWGGKEPALRQIKLAWWRDALAALDAPNARAPAEPLLGDIASGLVPIIAGQSLAHHADAKLMVVSSDWAVNDVMAAGASLFALTARLCEANGAEFGGAHYGLTSAALAIDDDAARGRLFATAAARAVPRGQPHALAVLDRLAQAIARHGGKRRHRREQALILRVGLFGR